MPIWVVTDLRGYVRSFQPSQGEFDSVFFQTTHDKFTFLQKAPDVIECYN